MLTIDKLREYGANVEEGLARCINNEDFYIKMINIAIADPNFEKLESSLDSDDLDTAFEAAHALKGMLGNLSLTPIYDPVYEITELLRGRKGMDYTPYLNTILEQLKALKELA